MKNELEARNACHVAVEGSFIPVVRKVASQGIAMEHLFTVQTTPKFTVVEFQTSSLMNSREMQQISTELYRMVDQEARHHLLLDFSKVKFVSSQALGIVMTLHKKLTDIKPSTLVLCGVAPALMTLLKMTRLDRLLKIISTRQEAAAVEAQAK